MCFRLIVLFFLTVPSTLYAQQGEAEQLLASVLKAHEEIIDYQTKVRISIDVDFLKAPDKEVQLFFKRPDKWKVKSKGFFLLPKQGFHFNVQDFLQNDYSLLPNGEQEIEDRNTVKMKIIPLDDKADFILATLWIDPEEKRIVQTEVNSKKQGSYLLQFFYQANFPLPEKVIIHFEVASFQLPLKFLGNIKVDKASLKEQKEIEGKVTLYYYDYQINKGLENDLFIETNNESL